MKQLFISIVIYKLDIATIKMIVFDLPEGHVDYGKNVAAYYYWVFPNMMFNFYPWGLSINIVKPIDLNRTKVSFHLLCI